MQWVILNLEILLAPVPAAQAADWSQRQPDAGALAAVARLARAGHHLVLISAEHDNLDGKLDCARLCALHARINEAMTPMGGRIDAALYCPHGQDEACDCRTPQPGLLRSLGERLGISLSTAPLASARVEDLQAAAAVGAPCVYIGADPPAALPRGTVLSAALSTWVADYLGDPRT